MAILATMTVPLWQALIGVFLMILVIAAVDVWWQRGPAARAFDEAMRREALRREAMRGLRMVPPPKEKIDEP